ncbi:MAG: hypothetical protein MZW92_69885 [Comamonadaceae bacterium]|nr:hypothetical protein [Comamonadaceae bacterium]
MMIFAEPRFATAIIDERDLAGLADAQRRTRPRGDAAARAPAATSSMLFLVGSCPSEVIKLDLSRAAAAPERSASRRACGCSTTRAAASRPPSRRARTPAWLRWCRSCRRRRRMPRHRWSSSAALADVVEDQFARLFAQLGIGRAWPSCRARRADAMPAVGPGTRFMLAQPFLADTARALEARGARCIAAPFPFGAEGTTRWLRSRRGGLRRRCAEASRDVTRRWPPARTRSAGPPARRSSKAAASSSSPTRSWRSRWRASWRANSACG